MCVCVLSVVVICTTSSVCSRRTLGGVNSGGAVTNVPPAKEEGVGFQLSQNKAAAHPWHRCVLKWLQRTKIGWLNTCSAQENINNMPFISKQSPHTAPSFSFSPCQNRVSSGHHDAGAEADRKNVGLYPQIPFAKMKHAAGVFCPPYTNIVVNYSFFMFILTTFFLPLLMLPRCLLRWRWTFSRNSPGISCALFTEDRPGYGHTHSGTLPKCHLLFVFWTQTFH